MIYQMGNLARSVDVRVAQVEMDMPRIIDRAIEKAMVPLRDRVGLM